jgi:GntR family phosphonate transport system transcriptional regulator
MTQADDWVTAAPLDRGSGVALWRQIADAIRQALVSGLAGPDGRLPSEAELASSFGVNRHTVRVAIAALEREGTLDAQRGRGTFVRHAGKLSYAIRRRTRFSTALEGQARERSSLLLSASREAADAATASLLDLKAGQAVLRLETLGAADGVPLSRATVLVRAEGFAQLVSALRRSGSLTAAFAACGIGDYLRRSTVIEARAASVEDAADLNLSPGAPVLVTRALNVEPSGRPLHHALTRFAADRIELTVEPSPE